MVALEHHKSQPRILLSTKAFSTMVALEPHNIQLRILLSTKAISTMAALEPHNSQLRILLSTKVFSTMAALEHHKSQLRILHSTMTSSIMPPSNHITIDMDLQQHHQLPDLNMALQQHHHLPDLHMITIITTMGMDLLTLLHMTSVSTTEDLSKDIPKITIISMKCLSTIPPEIGTNSMAKAENRTDSFITQKMT